MPVRGECRVRSQVMAGKQVNTDGREQAQRGQGERHETKKKKMTGVCLNEAMTSIKKQ